MENEIMNYEDIEIMDDEVVAEGGSGISTGTAMLIGAGVTLAIGAGVKLGKKVYEYFKAKKEQQERDAVVQSESQIVADVEAK